MSVLEIRDSKNYAATVVRVPKAVKAENSDRLYMLHVFGNTIIGSEEWVSREGELAIFFPAETQLSEAYAKYNNLYRDSEMNDDSTQKGYLERNRRVRAIKLRGNHSNALLMPLDSVEEWADVDKLDEGDIFDHLSGNEVCRKFRVKEPQSHKTKSERKVAKVQKRVDEKVFPAHIDTDHWFRSEGDVPSDATLIVTQKLHGTSLRVGRPTVDRKLNWIERLAKRFGARIEETEFASIAGSRKVIKDPGNKSQAHFYGSDIWTNYLPKVEGLIPDGYVVYGELVGWVSKDSPIQKGHTYNQPNGEHELYVYRVSHVDPKGNIIDLSSDQVRKFCKDRDLKHVPELWRGKKADFRAIDFEEKDFHFEHSYQDGVEYVDEPVWLSDGGTGADEGVVIRVEGGDLVADLYKMKNASHYEYETKQLDSGEQDIEESQN